MSKHNTLTLLTPRMTDMTQTQTQEAGGRQCQELHLTYPNIIAKPGEVLLRAVIVTDLLVTASYIIGKGRRKKK